MLFVSTPYKVTKANPFSLKGTGTLAYSTGTLSVTSGSPIVTGSGTTWLGNVTAGHTLVINNLPFEIANVDTNTQITLRSSYFGQSGSGLSYKSAIFCARNTLNNLIIVAPAGTAVELDYVDLFTCTNVIVATPAGYGFDIANCIRFTFDNVFVDGAGASGITAVDTDLINFTRCIMINNGVHGFSLDTCTSIVFLSCPAINNSQIGFYLETCSKIAITTSDGAGNDYGISANACNSVQITGGSFNGNSVDGINFYTSGNYNKIIGTETVGNTGYGIAINAGLVKAIITSCHIIGNTAGSVFNAGTSTINADNQT